MDIIVETIASENQYKLWHSVIIEGIKIPSAYMWDGASIPRFLWRVVGSPFQPKFMAPSLLHDYRYEHGIGTRKAADNQFHKLLLINGVDKALAKTMYTGVRLFASNSWNKKGF